MLKQRVVTALVLVTLFLAALFALPALGWSALVVSVVLLGAFEWGRLAKLSRSGELVYLGLTLAIMAGMIGYALAGGEKLALLTWSIYALAAVFWLALALPWLLLGWHVRQPVPLALIGWLVLIPTGLAMIDLRAKSPWLLLGIMALVWMADIAAYFSGKKFGKRKLAPSISPGKTWEGVFGALVGVSVYAVLAVAGAAQAKLIDMPDLKGFAGLVLLSWLWVALSIIGDLFESAIKRQAGVKDSGTLLPGHGGVLDRMDAMTSTLPLAAFALLLATIVKSAG